MESALLLAFLVPYSLVNYLCIRFALSFYRSISKLKAITLYV